MSLSPTTLTQPGWIEVICGSMFSGKTEELIRRIKRAQYAKQRYQLFKPIIDNRYSETEVASHSELKLEASCVSDPEEIMGLVEDCTRIVGIDEAQFFSIDIISIAERLANRGIRVIVAGLDLDFRGIPFGPMPALMAKAEFVSKLSAVCVVCGAAASRSQRIVNKAKETASEQVIVGGTELYEARCRHHFEAPSDHGDSMIGTSPAMNDLKGVHPSLQN